MLNELTTGIRGPLLIILLSVALLLTAFAFEHLGGLNPCILCIYQRIPYFLNIIIAIAALLLIFFGSQKFAGLLIILCGMVFFVGGIIAMYHVGIEQHWWTGIASCSGIPAGTVESVEEMRKMLQSTPVIRCDEIAWSMFGISLSGYNLLASLTLGLFSFFSAKTLLKRPT